LKTVTGELNLSMNRSPNMEILQMNVL
jgi:hypothetical protein